MKEDYFILIYTVIGLTIIVAFLPNVNLLGKINSYNVHLIFVRSGVAGDPSGFKR